MRDCKALCTTYKYKARESEGDFRISIWQWNNPVRGIEHHLLPSGTLTQLLHFTVVCSNDFCKMRRQASRNA